MNENEINDIRKSKDFKGITFSKFKKSDAKKELLNALFNGKIEPACYWSAEFICAGHYIDLWNILLHFMSNNIHLGNPKLPLYIDIRFDVFKELVSNGYTGQELRLRNNNKIRVLFAEIMSILAMSRKNNSFDPIKIDKKDFDMANMTEKLKADNISYAKEIFMSKDPTELFIAINELAYHISKVSKNKILCCYWIEWILEFERRCHSKKIKCRAERRNFIPVAPKYQMEVIWMVWELFIRVSGTQSKHIKSIIEALLRLFCIHFTPAAKNKRKYILYFAVSLIPEYIDLSIPIYTDQNNKEKKKKKINIIYKQIKKNEQAPNTSYLFNNSFSGNTLEKTIQKLETIQTLSHIIPRK